MAKLPQINYNTSTKQLAKPDTQAPARLSAQRFQLIEQVGSLANQIAHSAAKHQANQARSATVHEMAEWSKEHDARSFYSAEELRELGINEEIIRDRNEVPAYEVTAGLYREKYERVIQEQGDKIWFSICEQRR